MPDIFPELMVLKGTCGESIGFSLRSVVQGRRLGEVDVSRLPSMQEDMAGFMKEGEPEIVVRLVAEA